MLRLLAAAAAGFWLATNMSSPDEEVYSEGEMTPPTPDPSEDPYYEGDFYPEPQDERAIRPSPTEIRDALLAQNRGTPTKGAGGTPTSSSGQASSPILGLPSNWGKGS